MKNSRPARPPRPPGDQLTPKQQRVFAFIAGYIRRNGYPPTIRDIGGAFGISSPNGVMGHLRALTRKGYIRRDEKTAERGGRARSITIPGVSPGGGFSLPFLGRVAAGPPLAAVDQADRLDVGDLFGRGETYVLEVRGDSMTDCHIADGDFVVVRRGESADNGQTVVAMVDGGMTLKRFFHRGDHVRLEPCNARLAPIVVDPRRSDVRILGTFVGVMRVDRPGRVA